MSEAEIARLREEIAGVDNDIVTLVAKRLHLAALVGRAKKRLGRPLRDEGVEENVHTRLLTDCARQGISRSFAEGLARLLIDESVRRQRAARSPAHSHGGPSL